MIELKPVSMPDFGVPLERPAIPAATYVNRCNSVYSTAGKDWLFVYADREHSANILHLTGFDPRFEEAILLLGPNGRRIVIAGNESHSFTAISPLSGLEVLLAQSLSLMGQDRTRKPSLEAVLREAGIGNGDTVGIVGWKYLESAEIQGEMRGFLIPHYMVLLLEKIAGAGALTDETRVLMHPETGQRAVVDADQIAAFEWASARASAAVWRVVFGTRPGEAEIEAALRLGYAGEPLSCHVMLSSVSPGGTLHGLASPSARRIVKGDGITTAVGYWGALSSRAGVLAERNDDFLPIAKAYFDGLIAWYETADIGADGGTIFSAVTETLAKGGLNSALNPGHLVSYDEWVHSPVRPGSAERIRSGMPFQVDIIPTPTPRGTALNCEDAVVFADAALRREIQAKHPDVWSRIEARRRFVRDELGVDLKENLLPISNIQLCLPPFWLESNKLLVRS